MHLFSSLFLALCSIGAAVAAKAPRRARSGLPLLPIVPGASDSVTLDGVTTGYGTFTQPIDHSDSSIGSFNQSYWWSSEFWTEGGPVLFFTPGEVAAEEYTAYLTTELTSGLIAEAIGGAIILIEHRYWGYSSPYLELTTDNLQYLTLNQSISDFVNFAQNVVLPFDLNQTSTPTEAAWLMWGGSYSGALAAWTASTAPGTFWAYSASSAPVEAISDYWQYFYPEQVYMAPNCSKDLALVVDHVDSVLINGTDDEVYALKDLFGLAGVEHNDDFASALQNGPWLWQENQFYYNEGFYTFCDAVEGVTDNTTTLPGAEGVGLEVALAGYANWFNTTELPGYCASYGYEEWQDEYNVACFDTYNATSPYYTDITVGNPEDRQWEWIICNQPLGYWQDGAPADRPSIVSKLVDAEYWIRQCPLFFPPNTTVVGLDNGRTEAHVNDVTKGWDFDNTTRLLYVNGNRDPWREASVSSDFRPGGPLNSTETGPVIIVPGGFHCSDFLPENGAVNAGVQAAIDAIIAQLAAWVKEFTPSS